MTLLRMIIASCCFAMTLSGATADEWVVGRVVQPVHYSVDWIPGDEEPSNALPDEGEVLPVSGMSDEDKWLVVATGMTLPNGSWVRTGNSGRLLLSRGEEMIQFKPDTTASITSWEYDGATLTNVEQTIGSLLLEVETRETKHTVVETPLLAAVVKGTGFTVTYDGENASVLVDHGIVEVLDLTRNESLDVQTRQRVEVSRSRQDSMTIRGPGSKDIAKEIVFLPASPQDDVRTEPADSQIKTETKIEAEVQIEDPTAPKPIPAPKPASAPIASGNDPDLREAAALDERRIARRAALQEERRTARIGTRLLERLEDRQMQRQAERQAERDAKNGLERQNKEQIAVREDNSKEAIEAGSEVRKDQPAISVDAANGSSDLPTIEIADVPSPDLLMHSNARGDGTSENSDFQTGQHQGSGVSNLSENDPILAIVSDLLDLAVGSGAYPAPDVRPAETEQSDWIEETSSFTSGGQSDRDRILVLPMQASTLTTVPVPASALLLVTALIGSLAIGCNWQRRTR